MTTGLLTTTAGQAAIAADLAGGADLVLSHVAFGDSNGVPYAPNEAQVSLVNEKYRSTIASVAVVAGAIVVDAVIPADTPDGSGRPSHGFSIAEAGLYSAAGTLIGVARMGNGYKPPPSSGQAAIATFRFKLPVANPSAISVVIDPQAQLQLGRNVRPFWMTVDGVQNAPPGAPAVGATYVIGAAPTGAWAGFANRLAQWVGVWALASAPEGHLVCDLSKAENDAARFLKRTAAGWASAAASEAEFGFARLATISETATRTPGLAVSPDKLGQFLAGLPIHADVKTSDARLTITSGGGNIVVTGATLLWRGWNAFDLTTLSAAQRTFATAASQTYHVRWYAPGTGRATPASDWPVGRLVLESLGDATYNPSALAEATGGFDTTFDSVLLARVVTNGANAATITTLANKPSLYANLNASGAGTTWDSGGSNDGARFQGSCTYNWGRRPIVPVVSGYAASTGTGSVNGLCNAITITAQDRYTLTAKSETDYLADLAGNTIQGALIFNLFG